MTIDDNIKKQQTSTKSTQTESTKTKYLKQGYRFVRLVINSEGTNIKNRLKSNFIKYYNEHKNIYIIRDDVGDDGEKIDIIPYNSRVVANGLFFPAIIKNIKLFEESYQEIAPILNILLYLPKSPEHYEARRILKRELKSVNSIEFKQYDTRKIIFRKLSENDDIIAIKNNGRFRLGRNIENVWSYSELGDKSIGDVGNFLVPDVATKTLKIKPDYNFYENSQIDYLTNNDSKQIELDDNGIPIITGDNDYRLTVEWNSSTKEKKPIIFFIHGGKGNVGGTNYSGFLDAKLSKSLDAVIVFSKYPLNLFSDFYNDEKYGSYGNGALVEIVKQLKWINEYAHIFGGDSKNLTLLGFSFGGQAIEAFRRMPLARGLFHKTISVNGGTTGVALNDLTTLDLKKVMNQNIMDYTREITGLKIDNEKDFLKIYDKLDDDTKINILSQTPTALSLTIDDKLVGDEIVDKNKPHFALTEQDQLQFFSLTFKNPYAVFTYGQFVNYIKDYSRNPELANKTLELSGILDLNQNTIIQEDDSNFNKWFDLTYKHTNLFSKDNINSNTFKVITYAPADKKIINKVNNQDPNSDIFKLIEIGTHSTAIGILLFGKYSQNDNDKKNADILIDYIKDILKDKYNKVDKELILDGYNSKIFPQKLETHDFKQVVPDALQGQYIEKAAIGGQITQDFINFINASQD